ncbi:MAG: hypothetical protein RIR98_1857 [Bacteroidota bacterium]
MAWGTPAFALGRYEWKRSTAATGWQVCTLIGEMAERSNAAVLKTVDCYRSGGSNPSLSAGRQYQTVPKRVNPSVCTFFFVL